MSDRFQAKSKEEAYYMKKKIVGVGVWGKGMETVSGRLTNSSVVKCYLH